MKPLIVVSLFGAAALLGLPAGAQVEAGQHDARAVRSAGPASASAGRRLSAASAEVRRVDGQPLGRACAADRRPARSAAAGVRSQRPERSIRNASERAPTTRRPTSAPTTTSRRATTTVTTRRPTRSFRPRSRHTARGTTTASYGYVWSPAASIVGAGFSPYATRGHWVLIGVRLDLGLRLELGLGAVPLRPLDHPRRPRGAGFPERCGVRPGSPGARATATSAGRRFRRAACASRAASASDRPGGSRRPAASAPRAPRSFRRAICPAMFARTTVVSTDRLLTHGRWSVHVNAGPDPRHRGQPRFAVARRAGRPAARRGLSARRHVAERAPLGARRGGARRHADAGLARGRCRAPQTRTVGRAPAYGWLAARAESARPPSWSPRPAQTYGSAGGYGHRTAAAGRPRGAAPFVRRAERLRWTARVPRAGARLPCAGAGLRPSAALVRAGLQPSAALVRAGVQPSAALVRAAASPRLPRAEASHFGSSGGGSHFGGSGGGHFGGFGGGGRRR